MSALTETTTGPGRWHVLRLAAALLAFAAAVLTVVASFLSLMTAKLTVGSSSEEVSISAWSATSDRVSDPGDVPANGYPLVFAALFLVVASLLAVFAISPNASAGTHRLVGVVTAVGAAFLIGTVWTVSGQVVSNVETVLRIASDVPGLESEATYDVGFWLLLVAGALGLAATVLALLPVRQHPWVAAQMQAAAQPHFVAPVADVPIVHRLPPEPPVQQVDPLTGQPLGQFNPYAQPPHSPPSGVPAPPTPGNGFAQPPTQGPPRSPQGRFVPAPEQPAGPAIPPVEDPLAEPRQP